MNLGQVTVSYHSRDQGRRLKDRNPFLQSVIRFAPREGWDSFALLVVAMSVVAFTVREADWVDTPGLFLIIFLSVLTGLILSKSG